MDRNSAEVELSDGIDQVCMMVQNSVIGTWSGGGHFSPDDISDMYLDHPLSMIESDFDSVYHALVHGRGDEAEVHVALEGALQGAHSAVESANQALWQLINDVEEGVMEVASSNDLLLAIDAVFRDLRGELMSLMDTLPSQSYSGDEEGSAGTPPSSPHSSEDWPALLPISRRRA